MPLYRINAAEQRVRLLLGIVVSGGVDFGDGTINSAASVRIHAVSALGVTASAPPSSLRITEVAARGVPNAAALRLHFVTAGGSPAALPESRLRLHEASAVGVGVSLASRVRIHGAEVLATPV